MIEIPLMCPEENRNFAIPPEPEVSVVVPTYREAANIKTLAARLFGAMIEPPPERAEMIIVDDDSDDGIEGAVSESPHRDRIRLLVRKGERGLASAVLFGLAQARGRYVVVMDADLSHPPELVCDLIAPIREGRAEMVVGSRYVPGGETIQEWGLLRRLNSRVATMLARPFASVTDPMSGFFAFDRQVLDRADSLNPIGYKIGLELMVKCACRPVLEIPINFLDRRHGRSKLTPAEQLRYLEHLSRLFDFKFPRLVPVTKFLVVTFVGFVGGLLWMLLGGVINGGPDLFKVTRRWALTAYWPSIAINLLAYWRYIKQMKGMVPIRRPRFDFIVISIFEWISYLAAVTVLEATTAARFMDAWFGWTLCFWVPFAAAYVTRFLLRKLAGHDIRGLPPRFQLKPEA